MKDAKITLTPKRIIDYDLALALEDMKFTFKYLGVRGSPGPSLD